MARVTDINIHAVPVYDGQNPAGLNSARQEGGRSESFGKALSDSTAERNNNDKKQSVKVSDSDVSTVGSAAVASHETRPDAASNRGQSQHQNANKPSQTASALTESSSRNQNTDRQDLPLAGKGLPKQDAIMGSKGEAAASSQDLKVMSSVNRQGPAITAQISPITPNPTVADQALMSDSTDAGEVEGDLAEILGLQSGLKGRLGDGAATALTRAMAGGLTQAGLENSRNGPQNLAAPRPAGISESLSLRQDASALNAAMTLPAIAEQASKAPLSGAAIAAAVVAQDRLADLDRRVRSQAGSLGDRTVSSLLTAGKQASADLGGQRQDGFADLLAKSASANNQLIQIPSPALTGQGQNNGQGALAPMLPTLIDTSALGGVFKLPSGFEISGGAAQGQLVTPFSQPAWAQELAQQAKFMVRDQLRFVELKLNPANLGSVEIVLKQDEEQTTLMFFAKNPAVREALEASLQKLQKSFDEDGLQLEQTFVSDQSLSEHRQQAASDGEQSDASPLNGSATSAEPSLITDSQAKLLIPANDQLLDLWA